MRTRGAWALVAVLIAAGCGDDPGVDAGGGVDAGSRVDAGGGGTDAGPGDAGGALDAGGGDMDAGEADAGSGGTDAGPDTDAGGATDAGPPATDAGSGLDAAATSITLSGQAVYANCQPVVAPDPVIAFWRATVSGAPPGVSSVNLTTAVLTISPTSGAPVVQNLTIDNPSIGISGGAGAQDQRKTAADVLPMGACGSLCSGASYVLVLTYDVGGSPIVITDSGSFGCVH